MANLETSLKECLSAIDGATAAALVDYTSGMALGTLGGTKDFNLEVAAAGNTDVVRAKLRTMEHLGLNEEIEDILITLSSQYHMIRLLKSRGGTAVRLRPRSRGACPRARRTSRARGRAARPAPSPRRPAGTSRPRW